jgi:hypothetical protein
MFLRAWERCNSPLTSGGNWSNPNWSCPQIPLTDSMARNAKPAAKTVRMFDRDGLYLEVSPRGGKWWRLKYRCAGKEKRVYYLDKLENGADLIPILKAG